MNYIDLSKLSISDANNADCIIALDNDKNLIVINNVPIPTKTSELTNDSGYITSIPSDYITDSDLAVALESYPNNTELSSALDSKQNTLISGENIKTINGTSIIGSGNITITSETTDLSNYYNKQEVNSLLADKVTENELGVALNGYVTETDLNDAIHNVEIQIPKIDYVTQVQYDSMVKDATTLYIIMP